ncbi:chromate transporter [Paraburkholderia sp. MM5384-R2]|uniref:chromate transporter n=1 Tax=Paraburkholderia sp. MM5384-R2 TaxID=2723097 RepID=UPI001607E9A1|nr:chromate transporter [Paraburkholderia sp. MM5384-R2]MBB5503513.1 chromate transporter [Paraburkholderia sp. MM5384-R2]
MTNTDNSRSDGNESLWRLFWVVLGLSSLSWGGLALMAQLEHHYVEREKRLSPLSFADLVALAWIVPGPVGCNVAVQLGHALCGRAGAWVAGVASVLPFSFLMTAFAVFYRAPVMHTVTSQTLVNHFSVVLAVLIALTWHKQSRVLVRGRLEWAIAVLACVALAYAHSPAAYVLLLGGPFALGWLLGPKSDAQPEFVIAPGDWRLLFGLLVLLIVFALPLPREYELALLWPRLAGAGLTLFGGGFSALPVLKTLFVTPSVGVSENDFTLAFALSPVSPGPLLNVIPFLGYLINGWTGACMATFALFVPSGCLIVFAQRYVNDFKAHSRFEQGMRMLRAATTAFLAFAVWRIALRIPLQPAYLLTAAFSALCLTRFKVPVYAVYATVAIAFGLWVVCTRG